VDKYGNTVDFLLTKRRQKMSEHKFFNKAIANNGKPRIVNIDKSGANSSVILTVNKRSLSSKKIKIRKVKYLNNIIEQDLRRIKRRIKIMTGFKDFDSVQRTHSGIEVVNIIKKDQIINPCSTSFKTFCSLVA
jgi:putative transposase